MDAVHIHLLLNHVPVIGAVIAFLLLGAAAFRRGDELVRAALALYVLIGLATLVVFLTGEPAEEAIESLPGFSDSIVERHEEFALVSSVALGVAATLALVALIVNRSREMPRWILRGGLVIGLGVVALVGYTANLGGQIRHTEIRPGGVSAGSIESPASDVARRDD